MSSSPTPAPGESNNNLDCNDGDSAINPNTVWYIGVDNDGDTFFGSTSSVTQCASPGAGYSTTAPATPDCNDNDANINPNTVWYIGVDNDGDTFFGSTSSVTQCASPGAGYSTTAPATPDCNDNDANINPNTVWYIGVDNDGDTFFGSVTFTTACEQPSGYSLTAPTTPDCNDNDANINPNTVWYIGVDNDGDTFFGSTSSVTQCASPGDGYSTTEPDTPDCDDSDSTVYPGAPELCDGVDNDCDNLVDDDDDSIDTATQDTWYRDLDGDGYGNASVSVLACVKPTGYVSNNGDCNDNNTSINPGATEIADNGLDEDCDGFDLKTWYQDVDGDGYGDPNFSVQSNGKPVGYVEDNTDCNDSDLDINPGKIEIESNGIDDDCNPLTPDSPLDIYSFNLENVIIKPNPFNETILIKLPSYYDNDGFEITLFDINGRAIIIRKAISFKGAIKLEDLEHFDQGVYFLKIKHLSDSRSVLKRLIKY